MDHRRFDAVSRHLSASWSRRSGLGMVLGLYAGLVLKNEDLQAARRRSRRTERNLGHDDLHHEVVGGTAVSQGTYSFVTYIQAEAVEGTYIWAGSLITPRHVLTSASVLDDLQGVPFLPEQIAVVLGLATLPSGPSSAVRGVTAIFRHPDFDAQTDINDVAILQLDEVVPPELAIPVALVSSGSTDFTLYGQPAIVAGWGETAPDGTFSWQLMAASMTVSPDGICSLFFGSDTTTQFCADSFEASSCSGDGGGPLFATELAFPRGKSADGDPVFTAEDKKQRKRRKRRRRRYRLPLPTVPIPPTQFGIVSGFAEGCPSGIPNVFTRLSAPQIRSFIASVAGV